MDGSHGGVVSRGGQVSQVDTGIHERSDYQLDYLQGQGAKWWLWEVHERSVPDHEGVL